MYTFPIQFHATKCIKVKLIYCEEAERIAFFMVLCKVISHSLFVECDFCECERTAPVVCLLQVPLNCRHCIIKELVGPDITLDE